MIKGFLTILLLLLAYPAYSQDFIINPYSFGGSGIPTDYDNLYAFENGADLGEDTKGSCELTNNGVVSTATSKIGSAAGDFDATTDDLTHATCFDISGSTTSFTWTGWIRRETTPTDGIIFGVTSNITFGANAGQYAFWFDNKLEDAWQFTVDNGSPVSIQNTNVQYGVYQFFAVGFDADADVIFIRIDDDALATASATGIDSSVQTFKMGEESDGDLGHIMKLDQVRFYPRVLTTAELDALSDEN